MTGHGTPSGRPPRRRGPHAAVAADLRARSGANPRGGTRWPVLAGVGHLQVARQPAGPAVPSRTHHGVGAHRGRARQRAPRRGGCFPRQRPPRRGSTASTSAPAVASTCLSAFNRSANWTSRPRCPLCEWRCSCSITTDCICQSRFLNLRSSVPHPACINRPQSDPRAHTDRAPEIQSRSRKGSPRPYVRGSC